MSEVNFSEAFKPLVKQFREAYTGRRDYDTLCKSLQPTLMTMFEQSGVKTYADDECQLTYSKGGEYDALDSRLVKERYPGIWEECKVRRSSGARLTLTLFSDLIANGDGGEEE